MYLKSWLNSVLITNDNSQNLQTNKIMLRKADIFLSCLYFVLSFPFSSQAKDATDSYYHELRQTEIKNAWEHWDRLYGDVIRPEKLLDNFRKVYSAYSPHREEESFVVCPWGPGPFRVVRHNKTNVIQSLPNSPTFAYGRYSPHPYSPKPFRDKNDIVVRPLTPLV